MSAIATNFSVIIALYILKFFWHGVIVNWPLDLQIAPHSLQEFHVFKLTDETHLSGLVCNTIPYFS